jgi:hypothetical protein
LLQLVGQLVRNESVRGLLRFSRCELLLRSWKLRQGESSGTQRKGNVRRWKLLPSNGTSVCVTVYCKVYSHAASKSPINPAIHPKLVCSH